jgi:signal transduction histidine kinase
MKISLIIFFSFFIILLLFSVSTYINYRQSELIATNADEFERSSAIVRHSNRFQRNFLTTVSGLRGYLLSNESFFIQTYDSAIVENENILSELAILVPVGSEQRIIVDEITQLHRYWVTEFAQPLLQAKDLVGLSDSSRNAFNYLYGEKITNGVEKDIQRSLQQKFSEFSNYEYGFRDSRKAEITATLSKTRSISFWLTVVSVIAGFAIAVFISRYIASRIVKMVTMANSIAGGKYNVRINDTGESELDQLAKALNDMATILNTNISLLKRQRDELDQFAHIASHDIKSPLRGIDNVVTWIEEDHSFDLPPKVSEYLTIIKGRVTRAENLLKGILDYSRIGKESQIAEIVDVEELLREVDEYVPNRRGIDLRLQPGLPIIWSERVPLLQVFTNLISNAFKHHDKCDGYVKVYYKTIGDKYEFFVEDNGPGIDKTYHEKIFQIFQTLHSRDSYESTGVGLAIVKKILDERNLPMRVISEPGKGSTFVFQWPKKDYKHAESYQYSVS